MKKLLSLILFIGPVILSAQVDSVGTASDSAWKDTMIYTASEAPMYPGGETAMRTFIMRNLNYPPLAIENDIRGTVYVSFVVEPDGTTTNHIIAKDIGYGCGKEVIRVIKIMPAWIPGKLNGKPVRVRTTLPVTFNFN